MSPPVISGAVEGIVDEAVFTRIVRAVRAEPGPVYGKNGKPQLLERLPGYNNAARFSPWLVLVDLDHDAYASRLIEFISDHRQGWRPSVAAKSADSLARCLRCLRRLVRAGREPLKP
jgi:hypothetical protein